MTDLFYRRPRLLVLTICLIIVAGLSSYSVMPRMEDPFMRDRAARVHTVFPGADAERVESLVTEKLEAKLREIEEIKELRSLSRAGISTILIELRGDVYEVDSVWSRIRDKVADAHPELPPGALEPDFERMNMKAYALLVALTWDRSDPPNFAVLRRLADQLDDRIKAIPGTEETDVFAAPQEEYLVSVRPDAIAALGLTAHSVAQQIGASDAKRSAGQLQGERSQLLLEVDSELDAMERIESTPIQDGAAGQFVQLRDIATVNKGIREPPLSASFVGGHRAITVGAYVRGDYRIDRWSADANELFGDFEKTLPKGVSLVTIFEQNSYVETRLATLVGNLLLGGAAVVAVILLMMGWRSALIVTSALPLSALMVLAGLRLLEIPIHQMSVTGLIIALGLLIDNAIVIVDEVTHQLREGCSPQQAVSKSVRHLAVPLFGSTLTTALAFAPIALMAGPAGEFVGSIAVSVILAICSSFVLAMTVVPALTAFASRLTGDRRGMIHQGFSSALLTRIYRFSLTWIFRHPVAGILLGVALPIAGFVQSQHLPEQFFPASDRDQFFLDLELPMHASLAEMSDTAARIRERMLQYDQVQDVHWFVGESAPPFYYNMIARRKNVARYAQGLVKLKQAEGAQELIHQLQAELDREFPQVRTLVRQLEQGPPFDGPVEVRLSGPDLQLLQALGDEIRAVMASTPNVIHTRAELSEPLAKLALQVDEESVLLAGLDHAALAQQLNDKLEGTVGGTVLEATEELPVRVRVGERDRSQFNKLASLDFVPARKTMDAPSGTYAGVPMSAVATIELHSDFGVIPRFNGERMNEVQAFITAGVLPASVLAAFNERLDASGFTLPHGYRMEYGGEAAKRDEAIGNLMANVSVLMVLMAATLVLSFRSFRAATLIAIVGGLSIGLGLGALWLFDYPFGFMAIIGAMGLMGVAINDAIVVLAAIRGDEQARAGDPTAVTDVVVRATRHIVATSLTTMAGFTPLVLGGGGFWPPLAIAIAGGVGGATILALYFVPSGYILAMCVTKSRRSAASNETVSAGDAIVSAADGPSGSQAHAAGDCATDQSDADVAVADLASADHKP